MSCYHNREMEPTRWSKFGGPSLFLDVAIMRSSQLENVFKFREEHAMGIIDEQADYITIDNILTDGYQKISLVEGDPGAGKTTLTSRLCKLWADNTIKILEKDLLFFIPLRDSCYHKINGLNELFNKLNCSQLSEYAQQHNGKGLVFILDGWDELPDHLQSQSFFHDIIFKKSVLTCSTIIVTSRSSCSYHILAAVGNRYYQILGFTSTTVEFYVREYFKNNPPSLSLLDVLHVNKHLCQHFYIPITVVIMCFVYRNSSYQLPSSLSKLYERFVLLSIRSNSTISEGQKKHFTSLQNIPSELRPVLRKLCDLALKTLLDTKQLFDEEELKDIPVASTEQFDGFGLLHVDHVTDEFGEKVKCYSFIHRAVQELLAALSISKSMTAEEAMKKYFSKVPYMNNVFPFIFGLTSKDLKPAVERAKEIFIQSNGYLVLQNTIFHCLFEAQDESLCTEFGKLFNNSIPIDIMPFTLLQYHHAFSFLSACKLPQLNVICSSVLTDIHIEVMAKYFHKSFTKIVSFCSYVSLKKGGFVALCRVLSSHSNLLSLQLISKSTGVHDPGCIKVLCDSICQHNLCITMLRLPPAKLCKEDHSLGHVISSLKSLESLDMRRCMSYDGFRTSLKSSKTFCDALCNTKSLKSYTFGCCWFSIDDIDVFSDIISQNNSIQQLNICDVYDANVIASTLQGLSTSRSITSLCAWPGPLDTSHTLGESLGRCLASNKTLTVVDFTSFGFYDPMENLQWSSEHVCCIFTGLQSNNTLVTLDISGCYIDKAASDAICVMLSNSNTSLKHLFLNPVHLEKVQAIAVFNSCINNNTLELLTLVCLPGGKLAHVPWSWGNPSELKLQSHEQPTWPAESIFSFAKDSEVIALLSKVQKFRQDTNQPSLGVLW